MKQAVREAGYTMQCKSRFGTFELRIAAAYKRLGIMTEATCSHLMEIRARRDSCITALRPIAYRCFGNQNIPIEKKLMVARALIFSRLPYAAGAWHTLPQDEFKAFSTAVMQVWRRTTSTSHSDCEDSGGPMIDDAAVILKFKLMTPATIIRAQRLNLCVRIAVGGNDTLKAVVWSAKDSQKRWLAEVEKDFLWLRSADSTLVDSDLGDILTLSSWVPMIVGNAAYWKARVKQTNGFGSGKYH